ncbi:MAG: LamG domain-containing protein [Tyzzerella sp.]|nr:LamG domain-containing protein [Tyzzerella sp.]
MKRKIALFLIATMLMFSFTACGNEKVDKDSTKVEEQDKNQNEEEQNQEQDENANQQEEVEKPQVNVISRYTFDNVDGTTVPDSGSNGYNGTSFGDPVVVEGKFGSALQLSGTNGVKVPVEAGTVGKQFTVSAWFKIEPGSPMRPYRIFSAGNWATNPAGYNLSIDTSYGKGCIIYSLGDSAGAPYWNRQTEFEARIMDSQWHHVAIAFDLEGSIACGYLDGKLMDIMTIPSTADVTLTSFNNLSIGGSDLENPLGEAFVGTLDEVCVTDYFFTESDITYLMDNTLFE